MGDAILVYCYDRLLWSLWFDFKEWMNLNNLGPANWDKFDPINGFTILSWYQIPLCRTLCKTIKIKIVNISGVPAERGCGAGYRPALAPRPVHPGQDPKGKAQVTQGHRHLWGQDETVPGKWQKSTQVNIFLYQLLYSGRHLMGSRLLGSIG